MFGLSPLITAGIMALALTAACAFSYSQGLSSRDSKLGHNFERSLAKEREVSIRREVNLWTQIGDERRARVELIKTVEKIDEISAEARAKLAVALAKEKAASQAALDLAMANIEELKNATSEMAKDWKARVIPDDITCGVFNGKGCDAPAYPATGADRDDGLAVRDGQPAAPAGSNP